jgi:hypothetical protein
MGSKGTARQGRMGAQVPQLKEVAYMSGKNRDDIRRLQDQIIAIATRRGYPDDCRLTQDLDITIGDLRTRIYPDYERTLRDTLAELNR